MRVFKKAWLFISLAALLGLPTIARAQGWAIQGQAVDQGGRPLKFALVRVCAYTASGAPCSPLTSLWSDIPQTHTISNPYTTDATGNFSFVVATGQSYIVQVYVSASLIYSYLYTAGNAISGAVVEVNSTPISPSSPANFVDTASVTWAFTGGQIKATAAGGGSPAPPLYSVQFNNPLGTFAGSGNFTYNPVGFVFLNDAQDGSTTKLVVEAQQNSTGGVGTNEVIVDGQTVSVFTDGGGSISGGSMLGFDAEESDANYPGGGGGNLTGYQSILAVSGLGRDVTGYESAIDMFAGSEKAGTVRGFQVDDDPSVKSTNFYGYYAKLLGADATGDDAAFYAKDVAKASILSNYCDIQTKTSDSFARLSLGCGQNAASTFGGPVSVNDGSGKAGFVGLSQGTAQSTVASEIGFTAPTSVTAYNMIWPGAQWTGCLSNDGSGTLSGTSCGGGGGFPFTLGSTSIAASSTTTAVTGLSVNGVTLQTGLGTGVFLNGNGGYSTTSGISVKVKYVSVEGCAQNTDLTAGGGTDATACINALWSGASPTNPILVYQDGASLISGNGLQMPVNGGAFLQGSGGGISKVSITNCSLTSNVATFTTAANTLTVGQNVQLTHMSNCSALDQSVVTVLSAGLTTTQFEANFTHANISSGAETATGVTVFGTGFYLAANSGDMVSNGRVPSGGSCEIPGGTVPSQGGAGFGVSNLVMNGNAVGQATNACFGIDIDNANNIQVNNVVLYNMRTYGVHMGNVSQVGIDHLYVYAPNAGLGAPINTDGVHLTGPASDIAIANSYFHTGDDAIALNSIEGYCGPIDRITISNSTIDNSRSAIRIYNRGAACDNGLSQLISNVTISNYSGTVYDSIGSFGFDTVGTLNPAVTNIKWANSIIDGQGTASGFTTVTNEGTIDLDNFTAKDIKNGLFDSSVGAQTIQLLKLHNVSLQWSSAVSAGRVILDSAAGGGGIAVTDAIVDGLGAYNVFGGTISAYCPFCGTGGVTNMYASNIDMNLFNAFSDSHVTNSEGQAGPNSWAQVPAGGPWTFHAYGGGTGFSWKPHSTGGTAFNRWYGADATTTFMCQDINNAWLQIGGLNTSDGCDSNFASQPTFIGPNYINFNRKPGVNSPAFGSVGNWTFLQEYSGTASADCMDWQGQAFGAGGPSTVLKYCNDWSVKTKNNTLDDGVGNATLAALTVTNTATAKNVTITGPGGAVNGTISFGANYGADAIDLYHSGTSIFGWGLNPGQMQFFLGDPTGSPTSNFTFNNGPSGLQPDGTNEFLRLNTSTNKLTLASGGLYGWASTNIAGGGSSGTVDTGLSRDSAGVVDVGNGTAGDKTGTINAATGTFSTAVTVGGNAVCQSTGTNCPSSTAHGQYYWSFPSYASDGSGLPVSAVYYLPAGLSSVSAQAVGRFNGTCTSYPVMTILDLGTSAGATSGTTLLTITFTTTGVVASSGTVSVASGHYLGISATDTIACSIQNDLDVTMTY